MAAQTYLSMLCLFKWGIFMFFAGMVGIMTLTVFFFYPETKGLPIEEAPHVFADHWCAHPRAGSCKLRGHRAAMASTSKIAHMKADWVRSLSLHLALYHSYGAMCHSGAGSGSGMRRRRPGRKRQRRAWIGRCWTGTGQEGTGGAAADAAAVTHERRRAQRGLHSAQSSVPACFIGPQPPPAAQQRTESSLQSTSCGGGDVTAAMEVLPLCMHSFSAKFLRQSILKLV